MRTEVSENKTKENNGRLICRFKSTEDKRKYTREIQIDRKTKQNNRKQNIYKQIITYVYRTIDKHNQVRQWSI